MPSGRYSQVQHLLQPLLDPLAAVVLLIEDGGFPFPSVRLLRSAAVTVPAAAAAHPALVTLWGVLCLAASRSPDAPCASVVDGPPRRAHLSEQGFRFVQPPVDMPAHGDLSAPDALVEASLQPKQARVDRAKAPANVGVLRVETAAGLPQKAQKSVR